VSAIPRPRLDRPPPRRPHVSLKRRSAEHHYAGLPAGQISAFERDRAGVGLVRLDRGKPHRGCARDAKNRAVLIEHRGSPWSPPSVQSVPKAVRESEQGCSTWRVIPTHHRSLSDRQCRELARGPDASRPASALQHRSAARRVGVWGRRRAARPRVAATSVYDVIAEQVPAAVLAPTSAEEDAATIARANELLRTDADVYWCDHDLQEAVLEARERQQAAPPPEPGIDNYAIERRIAQRDCYKFAAMLREEPGKYWGSPELQRHHHDASEPSIQEAPASPPPAPAPPAAPAVQPVPVVASSPLAPEPMKPLVLGRPQASLGSPEIGST
jgi:hypothetical protein